MSGSQVCVVRCTKNMVSSVCGVVRLTEHHGVGQETEQEQSEEVMQTEEGQYAGLTFSEAEAEALNSHP